LSHEIIYLVNGEATIRFACQFLNSLVKQNSPFPIHIFVLKNHKKSASFWEALYIFRRVSSLADRFI